MKWIIYGLLLVNISVFVWHYQSSGVIQQRVQMQEAGNEEIDRLQLVSELNQQKAETLRWCNSLGPFEEKAQAISMRSSLSDYQLEAQLVRTKENKRKTLKAYDL